MLKQLFDSCFEKGEDFAVVYEREKPQQISDSGAIEKMIDEVIAANPKQVEQYRGGKKTVSAFFVGQVMKLSKGQANPALLNELVTKKTGWLSVRKIAQREGIGRGGNGESLCCVLHVLREGRPVMASPEVFTQWINLQQRPEGYRIVAAFLA